MYENVVGELSLFLYLYIYFDSDCGDFDRESFFSSSTTPHWQVNAIQTIFCDMIMQSLELTSTHI